MALIGGIIGIDSSNCRHKEANANLIHGQREAHGELQASRWYFERVRNDAEALLDFVRIFMEEAMGDIDARYACISCRRSSR